MMIDYEKLSHAIKFYSNYGYKQIEVPWWVTEQIKNITKPEHANSDYNLSANGKVLVASGEQSFIYLMAKGMLPDGKYLTVTPCFRNEEQDVFHRKHFMKCELINAGSSSKKDVDEMIEQSLIFFNLYVSSHIIKTDVNDGISEYTFDIVGDTPHGEIELGSYGIRKSEYLSWVYGTGVAEPRLSMISSIRRPE